MTRWILLSLPLLSLSACQLPENQAGTVPPNAEQQTADNGSTQQQAAIFNDPDWQNWPLVSGQWMRNDGADASFAGFINNNGQSVFSIKCSKRAKSISIVRHGLSDAANRVTIATTFGRRIMNGNAASDFEGRILGLNLSANDIVLDELIFSRGSFGLLVDEQQAIRVPTSSKLARVVEDCR